MRLISHMISTFKIDRVRTRCKQPRQCNNTARADPLLVTCAGAVWHWRTHVGKHSKEFNLALRSCTGAACNLLISGQRRPLFVWTLPVPRRHWLLCALSLPATDREGGSVRRAGSQRRLSALFVRGEVHVLQTAQSTLLSSLPLSPQKTLGSWGGAGRRAWTSSAGSG